MSPRRHEPFLSSHHPVVVGVVARAPRRPDRHARRIPADVSLPAVRPRRQSAYDEQPVFQFHVHRSDRDDDPERRLGKISRAQVDAGAGFVVDPLSTRDPAVPGLRRVEPRRWLG